MRSKTASERKHTGNVQCRSCETVCSNRYLRCPHCGQKMLGKIGYNNTRRGNEKVKEEQGG